MHVRVKLCSTPACTYAHTYVRLFIMRECLVCWPLCCARVIVIFSQHFAVFSAANWKRVSPIRFRFLSTTAATLSCALLFCLDSRMCVQLLSGAHVRRSSTHFRPRTQWVSSNNDVVTLLKTAIATMRMSCDPAAWTFALFDMRL